MSKKIAISNENERYSRELKKLHNHHNDSLEKIKSKQKKHLDNAKKVARKDLVEVQNSNNAKIMEEFSRRDQRINKIKENYNKTTEKLNQELDIFKYNKANQLNMVKANFEDKYRQNQMQRKAAMDTSYDKNHQAIKNLNSSARDDKLIALEKNRNVMKAIGESHADKYYQTKDDNLREIQYLRDEHIDSYYKVKSDNKKDLAKLTKLHNAQYKNANKTQQAEFEKLVKGHKIQKRDSNIAFEKEYKNLLTKNNINVSTLDENTKDLVKDIKEKFLQNANLILEKSKDPFYQFKRIKPLIEDKGDHYLLSIKVPEHEKNLVQISGKKRNIKLTFNRLHQETFNDVKNVKNIAKKYESYSTTTSVKDIVNTDKIEKYYAQNMLHFTIPKA